MDPVVLVVDDNDDNRFTLSMRLETCGYGNIQTAENGREALEKMRSGPVDHVLLDIMMPELDCYGVLEQDHILRGSRGRLVDKSGAHILREQDRRRVTVEVEDTAG